MVWILLRGLKPDERPKTKKTPIPTGEFEPGAGLVAEQNSH